MKKDNSLVEWFLSFLNMDLENQPYGDLLKLVTELDAVLKGVSYKDNALPAAPHLIRHLPKHYLRVTSLMANQCQKVKDLQKALREVVEGIIKAYENANECADTMLSEDVFTSLRALSRLKVTLDAEARIEAPQWQADVESVTDEMQFEYMWKREDLKEATLQLVISSENSEATIKYRFLESFDGLPLKALRRCPMCGNWFLHLSKREREFCSNTCAARNYSRKKTASLKQDPPSHEEELDKKSDKNHESYKDSVHKIHPNADVKRRARRPKRKED